MTKFSLRRDGKSKAATKKGKWLEIWYDHQYKVSSPRDEQKKSKNIKKKSIQRNNG